MSDWVYIAGVVRYEYFNIDAIEKREGIIEARGANIFSNSILEAIQERNRQYHDLRQKLVLDIINPGMPNYLTVDGVLVNSDRFNLTYTGNIRCGSEVEWETPLWNTEILVDLEYYLREITGRTRLTYKGSKVFSVRQAIFEVNFSWGEVYVFSFKEHHLLRDGRLGAKLHRKKIRAV